MSEKAFFHNALESDLLSGRKQKRRLDAALGRTQRNASERVRTNTQSTGGMPRWVYIPAVAVLLVLTVALGAVVISRGLRNEQHQAEQPVVSEKQVLLSESAEIKLLPELDPEHRFDQTRINALGLPAYDEAEWSWLREATAAVTDLSATADSIRWTVELRVPKDEWTDNPFDTLVEVTRGMPLCFFHADSGLDTPDEGAQLVEFASPGEITFSETADEWIAYIPEICAMPQTYDLFPAVLPPNGEVKITNTLLLLDRSVLSVTTEYLDFSEDGTGETVEYPAALLGTVEHTFVFDAEALLDLADPIHIDVPLSGEYILSIHEGNGFHNERVSLDGVTLDAEIHYTVEGVCVILSIKDPGALSEVEQESLYIALVGGPGGTGDVPWANAQDADFSYRVYCLSRTFWGSARFGRYLIAIEPKDYAAAKEIQFFVNASYATGEADGEPREDWSWNSAEGALPALTMDCRQLPAITIPLPEVEVTTAVQQTPEPNVCVLTVPDPVSCSAALTEQLNKADAQTRLMISIGSIAFGNALESAFRYQGKSLPEWRDQPALASRSEEYEIWYHTIYPGIDEQNRDTPGWEKHDPNELFDSYWKERHTEAEITAYEQANEAYLTVRNAYSEWRDGESGKEALRRLWQQECDRLNSLGLSLMLTKISDTQYRLDGTATVERLRSFPAKDGYQYWISLQNDDSPIDE
jgi:hypothetical protein